MDHHQGNNQIKSYHNDYSSSRGKFGNNILSKSKAILKSWPKIRVCLLYNSYWVISSKIKKIMVVIIFLVNLVSSIDLIKSIKLIALVDLVEVVELVGLVDSIESLKLVK
jgi:hypothetical protein